MVGSNTLVFSDTYDFINVMYISVGDKVLCDDGMFHTVSDAYNTDYIDNLVEFSDGSSILVGDDARFDINLMHNYTISPIVKYLSNPPYDLKYFEGYGNICSEKRSKKSYHNLYNMSFRGQLPDHFLKLSLNERKELLAGIIDSFKTMPCTDRLEIKLDSCKYKYVSAVRSLLSSLGYIFEMSFYEYKNCNRTIISVYRINAHQGIPTKTLESASIIPTYKHKQIINIRKGVQQLGFYIKTDSDAKILFGRTFIPIGYKEKEE